MPLMFLGVLLSTSRGALVAMIIMTVFLLGKGLASKTKGKRAIQDPFYNRSLYNPGDFYSTDCNQCTRYIRVSSWKRSQRDLLMNHLR